MLKRKLGPYVVMEKSDSGWDRMAANSYAKKLAKMAVGNNAEDKKAIGAKLDNAMADAHYINAAHVAEHGLGHYEETVGPGEVRVFIAVDEKTRTPRMFKQLGTQREQPLNSDAHWIGRTGGNITTQ